MKMGGRKAAPVRITGRKITSTFWGEAWCRNLEAYSDYANRLPRGRTYVRNGSVIDLQIEAGRVRSLVSGSDIYTVDIKIKPLAGPRWSDIKGRCAGQIDSLVELLRGTLSKGVMEVVTRKDKGLFPAPKEISLSCSCPDWAAMCKHVAATLYGVGARLDHEPQMLFTLRGVDPAEMVEAAAEQLPKAGKSHRAQVLGSEELSEVFGVDIDTGGASEEDVPAPVRRGRGPGQSQDRTAKRPTTARKPTARAEAGGKKPAARKTKAKKSEPGKKTSNRPTEKQGGR